ncbi:MAG: FecR domain-containing protein [Cyclobacteriaceae bacterium]
MITKVNKHLRVAKLFVKEIFAQNSLDQSNELDDWADKNLDTARDIYNWDKFTERQISVAEIDTQEEWSRFQQNFEKAPTATKTIFWRVARYAAVAMIFIALGLYFGMNTQKVEDNQVVVATVVKKNPNGVKSQIQLPDGTHVWLNSASSISYLQTFSNNERLINLEGEAYFEVVKDKTRPFRVKTGNTTTTALGTSFNINAFDKENILVALNTGKVEVTTLTNKKQVILNPGEQVKIDNGGLNVSPFSRESILAWKDGTIYFENTDFNEMIEVLEKWYDVSIKIDSLPVQKQASLKATGKFKDQTLVNVLQLLGHSLEFEYIIEQKNVTLKF